MTIGDGGSTTAPRRPAWFHIIWTIIGALAVSFIYYAVCLRALSHWWFEDDPGQFAFVKQISNPVAFFTDLGVIKRFGGGGAIAPMQALSQWLDSQLAYRSVKFAIGHNIISLAATLVLLFYVLRRFALGATAALVLIALWLCLPATIAVNEFLSTRHYLEGFAASLIAILVAQALVSGEWRENWRTITVLALAVAHAALYKEVYATALPMFLGLYLYVCGRKYAAAANLVVLCLFFAYRYWAFGTNVHWADAPFLGPAEYLELLGRLPHIFAGNRGGYFLFVLVLLALVIGYYRRKITATMVGVVVLLLIVELAVVYPLGYSMHLGWNLRSTWDRAGVALNTTLLLTSGYLITKAFSRRGQALAALLALAVLIPGAWHAQQVWHEAMVDYRKQGKFYLEHPDRLLFCDLQGPWFIEAVHVMYEVPVRHHVPAKGLNRMSRQEMEMYGTIWRYVDGRFAPDPALYTNLVKSAPDPSDKLN